MKVDSSPGVVYIRYKGGLLYAGIFSNIISPTVDMLQKQHNTVEINMRSEGQMVRNT